jgi:hypothetical protein
VDSEAVYAHYALHRFNKFPQEFADLPRKEKAFVIASIKVQLEKEKAEADKIPKR